MKPVIDEFAAENSIKRWLAELSLGVDFSLSCVTTEEAESTIIFSNKGMCVGFSFVNLLYKLLRCTVEWHVSEGEEINDVTEIGIIRGPASQIIRGEPIALYILSRVSSLVTSARNVIMELRKKGWKGTLGTTSFSQLQLGILEKFALAFAGAITSDSCRGSVILLSRNHQVSSNINLDQIVTRTLEEAGHSMKVCVSCSSLDAIEMAIQAGAGIIRLENLSLEEVTTFSAFAKEKRASVTVEVCVSTMNIADYALPSVDIIATNSLCNPSVILDLSIQMKSSTSCEKRTETSVYSIASNGDSQVAASQTSEDLISETSSDHAKPTNSSESDDVIIISESHPIDIAIREEREDVAQVIPTNSEGKNDEQPSPPTPTTKPASLETKVHISVNNVNNKQEDKNASTNFKSPSGSATKRPVKIPLTSNGTSSNSDAKRIRMELASQTLLRRQIVNTATKESNNLRSSFVPIIRSDTRFDYLVRSSLINDQRVNVMRASQFSLGSQMLINNTNTNVATTSTLQPPFRPPGMMPSQAPSFATRAMTSSPNISSLLTMSNFSYQTVQGRGRGVTAFGTRVMSHRPEALLHTFTTSSTIMHPIGRQNVTAGMINSRLSTATAFIGTDVTMSPYIRRLQQYRP